MLRHALTRACARKSGTFKTYPRYTFLYRRDTAYADTGTDDQHSRSQERDTGRIAQQADDAAEQRRRSHRQQRLAKRPCIGLFIRHICLMVPMDQLCSSAIHRDAQRCQQRGDQEHNDRICQHKKLLSDI